MRGFEINKQSTLRTRAAAYGCCQCPWICSCRPKKKSPGSTPSSQVAWGAPACGSPPHSIPEVQPGSGSGLDCIQDRRGCPMLNSLLPYPAATARKTLVLEARGGSARRDSLQSWLDGAATRGLRHSCWIAT